MIFKKKKKDILFFEKCEANEYQGMRIFIPLLHLLSEFPIPVSIRSTYFDNSIPFPGQPIDFTWLF